MIKLAFFDKENLSEPLLTVHLYIHFLLWSKLYWTNSYTFVD